MVRSRWERIRAWGETRLGVPETELGRWPRLALRGARLVALVERRFRNDLCPERAASLAFASIIASIPATMIVLLSLQLFLPQGVLPHRGAGGGAGDRAGAPGVAAPDGTGAAGARSLLEPVFDTITEYVAEENREEVRAALASLEQELQLEAKLEEVIESAGDAQGAVAAIAILVLVFSAMALFRSAERAFTGIWRVERKRGTFEKLATFWLLLTAAPFILGISVYVKSALGTTIESGFGEGSGIADFFGSVVVDGLFPLSISFFAFILLMTYLPNTRVRLPAAAAGALTAALGWELGTRAFQLYVQNTLLSGVLGALGVVPFFLLWVYLSWVIVLIGAEVSYCWQHFTLLAAERWGRRRERTVARPTLALLVLERIYRAFRGQGSTPTVDTLAAHFEVPIGEVEEVVNALAGAEMIVGRGSGWLPARSAERLTPGEVLTLFPTRAGFRLPETVHGDQSPLAALLSEVDAAVEDRLRRHSFDDLLVDPEPPSP